MGPLFGRRYTQPPMDPGAGMVTDQTLNTTNRASDAQNLESRAVPNGKPFYTTESGEIRRQVVRPRRS